MIDAKTAPYAALVLRGTTGLLFLTHGLTKLFVFTPAGTAGFFESLGLPGWLGIVTMILEIPDFGGADPRSIGGTCAGFVGCCPFCPCAEWFWLEQPEWRMGISGYVGNCSGIFGVAGRWSLCAVSFPEI